MRAFVSVLTVVGFTFTSGAVQAISAEPPGHAGNVSQRILDVTATPQQVYAMLLDYERWPTIFETVHEVKVVGGEREHARVAIKCGSFQEFYTLAVDGNRDERITVELLDGKAGTRVNAWLKMIPLEGEKGTRLVVRVQSRPGGALASMWPDFMLRRLQEKVLGSLLEDFQEALKRDAQ